MKPFTQKFSLSPALKPLSLEGRGVGERVNAVVNKAITLPCRAHLRLHTQTASQAGSMLPETPATPLALSPQGRGNLVQRDHRGQARSFFPHKKNE